MWLWETRGRHGVGTDVSRDEEEMKSQVAMNLDELFTGMQKPCGMLLGCGVTRDAELSAKSLTKLTG